MRRAAALAAAALALVAGGCADDSSITAGGRVAGTTLTVYSALPAGAAHAAATEDLVLGEKLALAQAGGRAGGWTVNYAAVPLPSGGGERTASAVREIIRDPGIAAVIGDLTYATARVSVPLFNAAGILHVSPGVTYPGFTEAVGEEDPTAPDRYLPAGTRSFHPLLAGGEPAALAAAATGPVAVEAAAGVPERVLAARLAAEVERTVATEKAATVVLAAEQPREAQGLAEAVRGERPRSRILLPAALASTDVLRRLRDRRAAVVARLPEVAPAFAAAFEEAFGREPGPWAVVGHGAMRAVLDAVERAGERANVRRELIEAFEAPAPPPFALLRREDGRDVTAPVR